jgi:hypothetical protein
MEHRSRLAALVAVIVLAVSACWTTPPNHPVAEQTGCEVDGSRSLENTLVQGVARCSKLTVYGRHQQAAVRCIAYKTAPTSRWYGGNMVYVNGGVSTTPKVACHPDARYEYTVFVYANA